MSASEASTSRPAESAADAERRAHYQLERVIVTCLLTTCSDLRIGSGFSDPPAAGRASDLPAAGAVLTLCRDLSGAPYIPASTLRGFLRRQAAELDATDAAAIKRLFGSPRAETDAAPEAQSGGPGALRVYDARMEVSNHPDSPIHTQSRIAVDPITGTVRNRFLFTEECVKAGSALRWQLELDRVDEADLEYLIDSLLALDGGLRSGLGAGRSRLGGRLALGGDIRIRTLSRADFRRWLHQDRPLDLYFQEERREPAGAAAAERSGAEGDALRLVLHIRPSSPLLVSAAEPERENGQQMRAFQTRDGRIYIPASSLKGMLRAQSRRILMTMLVDRAASNDSAGDQAADLKSLRRIAEAMIGEVFGNAGAMASLWVSEAVGGDAKQDQHPQHFNAIDRFTGGVADQRLYQVRAATPKMLPFRLLLRNRLLKRPWAIGLLLYLLRDALEGDLGLGWGRSRGYGQIRIIQAEADPGDDRPMPPWPMARQVLLHQLLACSGVSGDASGWLDALEREIQSCLGELNRQNQEEQIA